MPELEKDRAEAIRWLRGRIQTDDLLDALRSARRQRGALVRTEVEARAEQPARSPGLRVKKPTVRARTVGYQT